MAMKTLRSDPDGVAKAARRLRSGALVAFPTETVYGLGADATNGEAVARIFEAKGRPHFNPLIVHVASLDEAQTLAEWSGTADRLAEAFWPGPMTLVLPRRIGTPIADLVTAGLNSIALRMPAHPTARALLQETGRPLAAPSANPSGRISATTAEHVRKGLAGRIDAVLDDGPCEVGLESTIVGLDGPARLLRPGGLAREQIETVLGTTLGAPGTSITAPGQLSSHYAPGATLRLNAPQARSDEVLIGFGAVTGQPPELTFSKQGDLIEAAANLFGQLHKADATGQPIAVAPIPNDGLGFAINDRLARAAAPRDPDADTP